ncbi:MAG: hypothetical protein E7536_04005 [Ruminococcaceae bacterium]|nr:hypothetical protein [Oscillospiraceae bacterium]
MFCQKCGNQVPDGSANCNFCGAPQQIQPSGFEGESQQNPSSGYEGNSQLIQPATPTPKPKKNNKIILIVIIAVLAVVAVVAAIFIAKPDIFGSGSSSSLQSVEKDTTEKEDATEKETATEKEDTTEEEDEDTTEDKSNDNQADSDDIIGYCYLCSNPIYSDVGYRYDSDDDIFHLDCYDEFYANDDNNYNDNSSYCNSCGGEIHWEERYGDSYGNDYHISCYDFDTYDVCSYCGDVIYWEDYFHDYYVYEDGCYYHDYCYYGY